MLIATNTTHAANEHLFKKIPYDPVRDFAPVTALARGGQVMVVHPRVPVKTVKEFIALAKRQPGKLTFGSGSSSSRVASELFQQMAGLQARARSLQEQPDGGDAISSAATST